MHVGEHFGDGRAAVRCADLQRALWKDADKIDEDGVVAVPRVEQSFEKIVIRGVGHSPSVGCTRRSSKSKPKGYAFGERSESITKSNWFASKDSRTPSFR